MPSAKQIASDRKDAYCPHCGLLVERGIDLASWPVAPVRCPHCRLLIGAGRGRSGPECDPGTKGAAAGVLSRQARRDEDSADAAQEEDVIAAIREVARDLGMKPERLLMVDYQQRADSDPAIPPLRDVFTHFASWKRARRIAAGGE